MEENKKPQLIIVGAGYKGRMAEFIKRKELDGTIVYKPSEEPKDPLAFLSESLLVKDDLPMLRMLHNAQLGSLSGRKKRKKRHKVKRRKKR